MTHARKQIRDYVVTLLTGLPTTGNNVFNSRSYDLQDHELPGLRVYTSEEESEESSGNPPNQDRLCEIRIEILVRDFIDPQSVADGIAEEVENAIGADTDGGRSALGGLVKTMEYQGMTSEIDPTTEQEAVEMVLIYEAMYRVNAASVGTIIS